ncbi:MAG: hypothetical protein IJ904_05855 [Candidatus Methanomethylophilaceae archaeon]|nr:hypothetical protein [Candidatus Methanomethylophilaceae archaeon]
MKKNSAIIIYHRIDCDGMGSYAIARKWCLERKLSVTPFPFNHGDDEPSRELLAEHMFVIIVDIALPKETMSFLLERSRKGEQTVFWVDHHKSSIADSVKDGYFWLPGLRKENGKAACELAWDFFFGEASKAPLSVLYLSAYDTYSKERFDWDHVVLPFQYGIRQTYGLDAERFADDLPKLMRDDVRCELISKGETILEYVRDSGYKSVNCYGFPVTVAGRYKAVCCLTNQFGSIPFEAAMEREGCYLCICVNRLGADRYKVSVFGIPGKNTLDLSVYMAKKYEGGGHFNAAGGTLTLKQFVRLVSKCVL